MKEVLVRISDPANFEREAHAAARLAADLHGSLTGLYPLSVAVPPPSLQDAGLVDAEWALKAERKLQEARGFEASFAVWARSMGVQVPVWAVGAGYVPDVLAQASDWHDLLVLGLNPAAGDPWSSPDGLARIVLGVDLPCLVLPARCELAVPPGTVVVAWNGSPQAVRALRAAMPLLERAPRVVVLEGTPRGGSMLLPGFGLQSWMQARVPHVEYSRLDPEREDGAAILDAAAACGAGLLVMGAFGRTRASEWLLGGVTRHVLHHAALPVLMRH